MAGLSTKAIKNRIKSMQSTRQITKAMELVATSKLRNAQMKALMTRPYFDSVCDAMRDIASVGSAADSIFLRESKEEKPIYIVIAGDRGLAGGYNSNVFKKCAGIKEGTSIIPIGKRAVDYFKKRNYVIETDMYSEVAPISNGDCYSLAKLVCEKFAKGECDSVNLIYTRCDSLLSQVTSEAMMLPLMFADSDRLSGISSSVLYEPAPEVLFDQIVPEFLGAILFGAINESIASEQAARRNAMNSASKNADEIIANLDLAYNRARQGAITQEITEIVAGSNA